MNLNPKTLPPAAPGALPFLGHVPAFFRNPVAVGQRGVDAWGEIFSVKLPVGRIVVLTGPEAHKFFFAARESELSMSDFSSFALKVFYGAKFTFEKQHDFPFSQVKFFTPVLVESRMRTYPATLAKAADEFLSALPESSEVDLLRFSKQLLLRLTTRCLLGNGWSEAALQAFEVFFLKIDDALGFGAIAAAQAGLTFLTTAEAQRKQLEKLVETVLADDTRCGKDSLFGALKGRDHPAGRPLTTTEITGLTIQFLFAAHTPASVAFAWTLLCLARNPEWNARLLRELPPLQTALAENSATSANSAPSPLSENAWAHLNGLETLEWTLLESLRLHPPTTFHGRVACTDLTYKGFLIPAKSRVLVIPKLGHSLPEYFPQPELFDPERFAPHRREFARAPHTLVNFGGGAHHCVGKALAMMQMKTALASLLCRFEVKILTENVHPEYKGMVTVPSAAKVRLSRKKPAR